jgi:hypothetical protein
MYTKFLQEHCVEYSERSGSNIKAGVKKLDNVIWIQQNEFRIQKWAPGKTLGKSRTRQVRKAN